LLKKFIHSHPSWSTVSHWSLPPCQSQKNLHNTLMNNICTSRTIDEPMHVSVCQNIAYVTRVNKVEKSNFSYGTVRTHIYKQSHANQGTCRSHSKPIHSNSYKQVGTRGKRGQIGRRCACFSLTWWGRAMRITDPKSLVFNMCTAFT
jgi:hypothetical protein